MISYEQAGVIKKGKAITISAVMKYTYFALLDLFLKSSAKFNN